MEMSDQLHHTPAAGINLIGGWVGSKSLSGRGGKEKNPITALTGN